MTTTFKSIPFASSTQINGLAKLTAQIRRLNSVDKNGMTYEQLDHFIVKELKLQIPHSLHPDISFSPKSRNSLIANKIQRDFSLPLYRIRLEKDFSQDPLLISSHGVPPKEATSRGRANIINCPVLYLAFLPQTAAIETGVIAGDVIYLSIWTAKGDQKFNLSSYFLAHDMLPGNWQNVASALSGKLEEKLTSYTRDKRRSVKHIINLIHKWFLNKDDHVLSSYLSHNALYQADLSSYGLSVDCILYPSVAEEMKSANLAIGPSGFEKVEMKRLIKMKVTAIAEKGLHGELIGIAEPASDNVLRWLDDFEFGVMVDENIKLSVFSELANH